MVTSLAICVKQKWELSVKRASLPLLVVQATPKQQKLKFPASSNASTMCKSINQSIFCSILLKANDHFIFDERNPLFDQFLTFSAYFTVRNTLRVSARPSTRLPSLAWNRVWAVETLTTSAKAYSKTSPIAKTDQFKRAKDYGTLSMF